MELGGKNLEIWKKSEILEENLEIWEKFGNRIILEMRGIFGKHLGINWKSVKQFGTWKNIGNLKKKLEIWKKIGICKIRNWKLIIG